MVIEIIISYQLGMASQMVRYRYNRQFIYPYENPITSQIIDIKTGEISDDSFDAAKRYGLLERDVVLSILNRTYVWPTYQQFTVVQDTEWDDGNIIEAR